MQQLSELFFASSNEHKFQEAERILANLGMQINLFKTTLEEIQSNNLNDIAEKKAIYTETHDSNLESFHSSINKYLDINKKDLHIDYTGIRPKPFAEYEEPKDFIIKNEVDNGFPNFINLIGIESPGLTSSLAIAKFVKGLI